jgi:predicted CXXCH cytochrome family protein
VSAICAFGLLALAGATGARAQTIDNTPHDLPFNLTVANTTEICVFCHTPHNAGPTTPLWNRTATTAVYTPYSSPTLDANGGTAPAPTGVSLLCLSCHDGTVAFDSLINNPDGITVTPANMTLIPGTTALLGTDMTNDHPISIEYGLPAADFNIPPSNNLPLFDPGANTVECASCHNPHDNQFGRFLRVANTNSDLCLSCHIK